MIIVGMSCLLMIQWMFRRGENLVTPLIFLVVSFPSLILAAMYVTDLILCRLSTYVHFISLAKRKRN